MSVLNFQVAANFSINPLFPLVTYLFIRVEVEGAEGTEGVLSEDFFCPSNTASRRIFISFYLICTLETL